MLGFFLQLGCTFTNSFSWTLFRDSDPATWCQNSTFFYDSFNFGASSATKAVPLLMVPPGLFQYKTLAPFHDPLMSSKSVSLVKLSHITKFGCQHKAQHWPHLDHSFFVLPRGNTSQKRLSQWCWSLFKYTDSSAPTDQYRLSQQSKKSHFSVYDILLITDDSIAP